MDIHTLYSGTLLTEAAKRLQSVRGSSLSAQNPMYTTRVEGPEVVSDEFLINWLGWNYLSGVGFDWEGKTIMGEIGGVVAPYRPREKRILGISEASLLKVLHGITQVQRSRKKGNKRIITALERELEMPLEDRDGITIVNGNRNVNHYDFTCGAAWKNPIDMIFTTFSLLFHAEGGIVLSSKHLPAEQYVLNVPIHDSLFEELKPLKYNDFDRKHDVLKKHRQSLLPAGFIAGFHFHYHDTEVSIRPLIAARDSGVSLADFGLSYSPSLLTYLGTSDAYGRITSIKDNFL